MKKPIDTWRERLDYLLNQEAISSGLAQKFELQQLIKEARQKIAELEEEKESGPFGSDPESERVKPRRNLATFVIGSVGCCIFLVFLVIALPLGIFQFHKAMMPSERRMSGMSEKKPQIRLRSEKSTLSVDQAKVMISAHNFYRTGWNDSGTGIEHEYEAQALDGAHVVADHATGLMWQKGGSDDGVGLPEAERYVGDLNAKTWAGFSDWRLPTLEEAMSLMTTDKDGMPDEVMVGDERVKGVMHLNPAFGKSDAPFIWTSDSYSPGRGWVVYFWDAKCAPEDIDFNAYVRAVRSFTKK
jgi:Protein of unknown function (DUF1566)